MNTKRGKTTTERDEAIATQIENEADEMLDDGGLPDFVRGMHEAARMVRAYAGQFEQCSDDALNCPACST